MCPPFEKFDIFPLNFHFVCPNLRQVQHLGQYRGFLNDFFSQKDETWFWKSFAEPVPDARRIQHFHPPTKPGRQLSALERLPAELIEELIDTIVDDGEPRCGTMDSLLAFGLSSACFWPIVLHRIHQDYRRALSSTWAGQKVGYHGHYSHFTVGQSQRYGIESEMSRREQVGHWSWISCDNQPEVEWRQTAATICTEFSARTKSQIQQDLSQAYMYPQDRIWVLRNLTTKQLVRSDKLQPPEPTIPRSKPVKEPVSHRLKRHWKDLKQGTKRDIVPKYNNCAPLTLAQIFLVLTAYTTNFNIPFVERNLAFQQGPWVGCAFDLVTLEDHLRGEMPVGRDSGASEDCGKPWADVSELVVADVGNLRWCVWQCHVTPRATIRWKEHQPFWDMIRETRRVNRAWTELSEFENL